MQDANYTSEAVMIIPFRKPAPEKRMELTSRCNAQSFG